MVNPNHSKISDLSRHFIEAERFAPGLAQKQSPLSRGFSPYCIMLWQNFDKLTRANWNVREDAATIRHLWASYQSFLSTVRLLENLTLHRPIVFVTKFCRQCIAFCAERCFVLFRICLSALLKICVPLSSRSVLSNMRVLVLSKRVVYFYAPCLFMPPVG